MIGPEQNISGMEKESAVMPNNWEKGAFQSKREDATF